MKYKESAVIIDYKSFDPDIDISTLNHGLNMQLPMYLYLMKKLIKFKYNWNLLSKCQSELFHLLIIKDIKIKKII